MSAAAWVLLAGGVLAGLFVGSFCNVVIDRLPLALDGPNEYGELWDTNPWGHVLGVGEGADSRSRCSECGEQLRWSDNIPVVSYLRLRGRCRACGEPYGAYHLWVELFVPVAWLLVTWGVVHFQGWTWALVPYLFLVPVGAVVATIDLHTLIVPTRVVWPAAAVTAVMCVAVAGLEGQWAWLAGTAVGVVGLAGPLFLLWFALPAGMGFGDVRLSVLLGLVVGLAAASTSAAWPWSLVLAVMVLALSSALGILLAIVRRSRKVPFGPALVLGTLICVTFARPILEPFTG